MSSEETPTGNLFLNDFADVSTFKDTVCANVMKLIRSSNDLSRASDHDFLMSFAPLRQRMDRMAENLLKNANQLLKEVNIHRSFGLASWKEADHDDKLEQLIDINDILFERISSSLDEAAGLKKQSEVKTLVPSIRNVPATWSKTDGFVLQETVPSYKQSMQQQQQQANKRTSNLFAFNHQQSKNIPKPQLKFTDKVNNNPQIPFVPKIRTKPNAQTPLPTIFGILDSQTIDSTLFEKHPELLSNPYFDEIEAFQPSDDLLRPVEPQLPQPIDQTKCSFVDTPEKLRTMIEHIEMQSELAIDLEHHSFRSYQGFTCLMQISSRTEDFLVDTIALRDHLTILNEIFTNPNVVKVLHGADSDVEWLQKDFGLYLVNMFDTHQAARELNLPSFSLAYLLKSYCDIDANKQYQLADWRIRPLPEELLNYAREDTHYLLYIYDLLRNRLLQLRNNDAELIQNVYQKSKMLCQKVYRKAPFDENAYEQSYRKSRKIFNVRQLAALKSLYYWRDRIARQEDESIGYVLPNHMLLQIAEILPREAQGVRACCNPVPLLVQHNLHDIHQLILKVRDIPLIEEPREQNAVPLTLPILYDPENVLYCPHDTSHQIEQQYPSETTKKVPHPNDLSSILDQIFLDESKQREEHLQSNTLIQLKTELLPTTKPRATKSRNAFDPYMPESYRTGLPMENKPIWKVYYPDRDPSRKVHLNETNHQNGSTISKEKLTDDIEMIMLKKQNGKRKRKGTADENSNAKMKNKRYRRGCVADEVPSTIILENDEEAGEISDEPSPNIRPFDYEAIEEEKNLSNKKFKRPADDEEIYDPNRSKKSSTVKTPKRPGAQQTHKSLTYPFPKKP